MDRPVAFLDSGFGGAVLFYLANSYLVGTAPEDTAGSRCCHCDRIISRVFIAVFNLNWMALMVTSVCLDTLGLVATARGLFRAAPSPCHIFAGEDRPLGWLALISRAKDYGKFWNRAQPGHSGV